MLATILELVPLGAMGLDLHKRFTLLLPLALRGPELPNLLKPLAEKSLRLLFLHAQAFVGAWALLLERNRIMSSHVDRETKKYPSRRLLEFVGSAHMLNLVLGIALAVQVFQNQTLIGRFSVSTPGPSAAISDNAYINPFSLLTIEGTEYRIGDNPSVRWLLIFFHTNCKYCHVEIPLWKKVYERTHERPIQVVAITMEKDVDMLRKFSKEADLGIPILIDPDGKVSDSFGVKVTPTKIFLSEDGRILHFWRGLTSQNAPPFDTISIMSIFDLALEDLPPSSGD